MKRKNKSSSNATQAKASTASPGISSQKTDAERALVREHIRQYAYVIVEAFIEEQRNKAKATQKVPAKVPANS